MGDKKLNLGSHVQIQMEGPGRGRVWINGVELQNVTRFKVRSAVGEENLLDISVLCSNIDLEGFSPVEITAEPLLAKPTVEASSPGIRKQRSDKGKRRRASKLDAIGERMMDYESAGPKI